MSANCWSRLAIACQTRFELRDQVAQLALALGERVEDVAGVAHEPLRGAALLAQDREHVVGVLGERREERRARRSGLAVALSRDALLVEPGGKRLRVSGSNARRISSSSTVSDTWPAGSVPPSCDRARGAGVAGRQLHVGLAEQRLLAQDRAACPSGSARSAASISSTASVSPVWMFGSFFLTRPTRTPEMRTSASCASCVA